MARAFRIALIVVSLLYVFALAIFVIGTFGLFGQERDPLSGVFLMPLGLPWNRFVDAAPERFWPWFAALAPLLNIFILAILGRAFARGRDGHTSGNARN